MIDWMNPSDDVLHAKRVGYHEGVNECEEYVNELKTEIAKQTAELRNVSTQRDALLGRLQWCNVNGGMAYILTGVDCYGISKLMQEAVEAAKEGA